MDINRLKNASLNELESLYASDKSFEAPEGRFRGVYLASIDSPGARRFSNRVMVWLGFRLPRFGVDFESRRWYFGLPFLQVGHFEPEIARSRWRAADTVCLHYHLSRLPGFVRHQLYDEVKPLTPDLLLGMGGLNRERGEGELFFFALTR